MKFVIEFSQEEKDTIKKINELYHKIVDNKLFTCNEECECCPFCSDHSDCAIMELREGMEALVRSMGDKLC